jgi:hypothetical protein
MYMQHSSCYNAEHKVLFFLAFCDNRNTQEATMVCHLVLKLKRDWNVDVIKRVCVVSFYNGQVGY